MAERGSARWLESDDFTALDMAELARLVDRTSERELRHRLIGGVREVALREIFRRMPEYLRPARAAEPPAISVRTDPATLLKIVTGNENPVLAVLTQRLSVRGDLALAGRLTKLFVVGPATTC
jgi:hypothetical protein